MKVLYINDFIYFVDGGAHVSACAHRDTLYELYGKNNVDIVSLVGPNKVLPLNDEVLIIEEEKSKIKLLINCLMGYTTYLNKKGIQTISNHINKNKYDVVFVDNSIYGKLVKYLKDENPDLPIVTYYHDVKAFLGREWEKNAPLYKKPVYKAMIDNEKINQIYSDVNLTLNPRETKLFYEWYHKKPELELSVYLDVKLHDYYINQKKLLSTPLNLLFIGSYYKPNVKGIIWFIENVLPKLGNNVKLQIAGSGMEELFNNLKHVPNNVNILGHVQNLSSLYENADVVLSPIFEGGGMKVKVAHASAYGKIIVGTDESFEGYQENIKDNEWDKFFYRCNCAEEFIVSIEKIMKNSSLHKYNPEVRDYFNQYYSSEYAKRTISKAIDMAIEKTRGNCNDNHKDTI